MDKSTNFYIENRQFFLNMSETILGFCARAAEEVIGKNESMKIVEEAGNRFLTFLPDIPYIGGFENRLTSNLVMGAIDLMVYKSMKSHDYSTDDIGKVIYLGSKYWIDLEISPNHPEKPMPEDMFQKMREERKKEAAWSRENQYQYGWLTEFVDSADCKKTWGVNYFSCGIVKLFREHQADEIIPYLCCMDLPTYREMGICLNRTKTLAQGNDRCDFRFSLKGSSQIEWQPSFITD